MDIEKISYAKTVYGQEEINAVIKCLNESTQMGRYSREFEKKVAKLFSKKNCAYVNSGSSALFLGIEALNFPKGSEVITPALTFSTTVGCLVKNNLIPSFVDVEPLSYCIDPNKIEELINSNTVAILAPNLLGNICDWPKIREIANKHNLVVIEDSADTIGAKINNIKTGEYTDMSITSFYGSHIINCAGNGGALSVNDDSVFTRVKLLRSWGRSSSLFDENSESIENRFNVNLDGIEYDAKFVFETIGYNLEGSEIGAAFGLEQLKKLSTNIQTRRINFDKQQRFFSRYDSYFSTPEELKGSETGWLAYPLLIKEKAPFSRKEFQIYLEQQQIQTRVIFTGNILRQPMCKNIVKSLNQKGYKNSDNIMKNGVLLPLHHGMSESMFNRLHQTIEDFLSVRK
ncbi:DegT/DnrJ/EryC1/StrS family aminotransferase [Prochlorococcus sp. MIT 1223]|uniref:DegT/DnrJ/EryC1/StrS family aminotransferase n=1 Tax=Prochlorococcus sp. MIT 1223 TaxID=3096217 RepID=UPI002A747AC0|nr:DegT/DnrJ/EryC1/StrS family aminotransferase [Prochlorococcus sp. MIT 1223]